mmetsp:Transcript_12054/g.22385  ORF Transcript_12054/g.22385 Transcript_12054/m.22385 type:complete len:507 (-) Transcript_12054:1238-2758(-)
MTAMSPPKAMGQSENDSGDDRKPTKFVADAATGAEESSPSVAAAVPNNDHVRDKSHDKTNLEYTKKEAPIAAVVPSNKGGGEDEEGEEKGLRENDVLTGRGSGPNQTSGNTRFREVVWETYQEYLASLRSDDSPSSQAREGRCPPLMDGSAKNVMAQQVLAKIRRNNGRFLRRICQEDYRNLPREERERVIRIPVVTTTTASLADTGSGNSETTTRRRENLYVELPTKEALEKIKQSLRFQLVQREQRESLLRQQQQEGSSHGARPQETHSAGQRKRPADQPPLVPHGGAFPKKFAAASGLDILGLTSALMVNAPGVLGQQELHSSFLPASAVNNSNNSVLSAMGSRLGLDGTIWPSAAAESSQKPSAQPTTSQSLPAFSQSNFSREELIAAALSLERQKQEQRRQQQQQQHHHHQLLTSTFLGVPSAAAALRINSSGSPLSAPSTNPSAVGDTNAMDPFSGMLLRERLDSELAARIRNLQEMKMASTHLLERHQRQQQQQQQRRR